MKWAKWQAENVDLFTACISYLQCLFFSLSVFFEQYF